jgi:DNA polymerase-3 subunit alpha
MKLLSKTVLADQNPTFQDVKAWYDTHLHPDVIDLSDKKVYEHVYCAGRWAGIFQFTAVGAQRFCVRAQPKNIIDIAAITSIYRPGPLVAGVDKDYVAAKNDPDSVVYEHPLIKEVLGKTFGFLVFQEQMLRLGNVVGKMPLAKCDRLRKVITKRSMSGKEKAATEAEKLGEEFIAGAIENGFSEKKAIELWDNMAAFKGYAFNLSHALSYAIDSYMCAWLLTYYEPEWLCAYMETQDGQPEKRSKALSELRSFGYEIAKVDINHASIEWTIQDGKKFMPALVSIKGVGDAAVEEIISHRPYKTVDELLYNPDGTWRHSKFNKRAFENLIKIGAFDSMGIIGENEYFRSYQHMWKCLIEDSHKLKHKKNGKLELQRRVKEYRVDCPEWDKDTLIRQSKELVGSGDMNLIITPDARAWIEEKLKVPSIDDFEKKGLYWFIADELLEKSTKNGKQYMLITAIGLVGKRYKIYCWGYNSEKHKLRVNTPYVAELEQSQFGFATQVFRVRRAEEKKRN